MVNDTIRIHLFNFIKNQHKNTNLRGSIESFSKFSKFDFEEILNDLKNGNGEMKTLFENGFLTTNEFILLENSNNKKTTYELIIKNINQSKMLKSGISGKLYFFGLIIVLVLSSFTLFNEDLQSAMINISDIAKMQGKNIPKYTIIDNKWLGVSLAVIFIAMMILFRYLLKYLYKYQTKIYYFLNPFRKTLDTYFFLFSFKAFLEERLSPVYFFKEMSKVENENVFYERFIDDFVNTLEAGGNLKDLEVLENPFDEKTKYFLIAGEESEALSDYVELALDSLKDEIESYPQKVGMIVSIIEALVQMFMIFAIIEIFTSLQI